MSVGDVEGVHTMGACVVLVDEAPPEVPSVITMLEPLWTMVEGVAVPVAPYTTYCPDPVFR
jgi:hypothetical protein